MPAETKPYERLTRNAAGVASYASLWLGDGHLLLVTSSGFAETYARVQLRDVQAIFLVASDRRLWWNITWAVPAMIVAIVMAGTLSHGQVPFVSGPLLLVFSCCLLWNAGLGPGCLAYVRTGVQTARLPSIVRMKQGRRVLARLQPLIEAAQGDLAARPVFPPEEPSPVPAVPSPAPPPA